MTQMSSYVHTDPSDLIIQYIPRNMHTGFALLCFVVVIHWLIFPYPSGLLHWHCGNLTIAPVPAKQPWWIWINTSCEFVMNDCITTTKQSTTKPCAYFLGYTVHPGHSFKIELLTLVSDYTPYEQRMQLIIGVHINVNLWYWKASVFNYIPGKVTWGTQKPLWWRRRH